jgi:hypothetical protein
VEFNTVELITTCLAVLIAPELRRLDIILRERSPSHDENYMHRSPCHLGYGRFQRITHLNLVCLPLCLSAQLILRLKSPAMQHLGIDISRLPADTCQDYRHLSTTCEDRSIPIRILQFRGFQQQYLRKDLIGSITKWFQFPNIEELYVEVPNAHDAPASISSLCINHLSPRTIVVGNSTGYRLKICVARSKTGIFPSKSLDKPPSSSQTPTATLPFCWQREVLLPVKVILTACYLNLGQFYSRFTRAGLQITDEINLIGNLRNVHTLRGMLQSLNEGPPLQSPPHSHNSRTFPYSARLARTFKRVKLSLMKRAQAQANLFPELQKMTIHTFDNPGVSQLPKPIVKELKKMVRRRRGQGSLKEIRWRVPPSARDIKWFQQQGIVCGTTSDRDYEA